MISLRPIGPILLSLVLSAPTVLHPGKAWSQPGATPPRTEAPPPLELDLTPNFQRAGSVEPINESALTYRKAKKRLARGDPRGALKILGTDDGTLFRDRRTLLRGDALLAIGKKKEARSAYLEAIRAAQLPVVSERAARGLANVLGQLKDWNGKLKVIDTLLALRTAGRRSFLMLERATILNRLRKHQDAADQAYEILRAYPASDIAGRAEHLLNKLKRRGAKVPSLVGRNELGRIRRLVRGGRYRRAQNAMRRLTKRTPRLKRAVELQRAEMYRRRRLKVDEEKVLLRLKKSGLTKEEGPQVLYRLGRLAMSRDEHEKADAYFTELERRFPSDPKAPEGRYLAAWNLYNEGKYLEGAEAMLAFAEKYKKAARRTEALWFAGWSAYMGNKDGLARRALEQLLEEHPTTTLAPHARYWLGRIRQRESNLEAARAEYREVLKSAPLSYYGFWAEERLVQLGGKRVVPKAPPPAPAPTTVRAVIALLGPDRPMNVDRALALHAVDLRHAALQELNAAASFLKRVRDSRGRTMVADMLHALGAHHLAFRLAMRITADGTDLQSGAPHAWRAWRHAYPNAFEESVSKASKAHTVDAQLVLSVMRTESHFRPEARSPVGARGLMQLMPATAKRIGRRAKGGRSHAARYKKPDSNVWLGAWYLSSLIERYSGQIVPAIGAYNAGPGAMDQWVKEHAGMALDEFVERTPYRETRRYMRRVVESYMVYRRLNGLPPPTLAATVQARPIPKDSVAF